MGVFRNVGLAADVDGFLLRETVLVDDDSELGWELEELATLPLRHAFTGGVSRFPVAVLLVEGSQCRS